VPGSKEISMMGSDAAARRFLVPGEVAGELRAAGYVTSTGDLAKGADVGMIVLTVFNTVATTVTLAQTPDAYRALAGSLSRWFHRERDRAPYGMVARGPHGHVNFESEVAPDPEAVAEFLRRNIWGEDAPADPPDGL
jgi:hypothetical protein